jgi:hypothetical protein
MVINYQQVVNESRAELRQRVADREELDKRINELRTALRALVKFVPDAERQAVLDEVRSARRRGISLAETIVDILSLPEYRETGLTSSQIRERLEEAGFDLEDYSQPLAAVMTTLQRLDDQKKVRRHLSKDTKGVIYKISVAGLLKKVDGN